MSKQKVTVFWFRRDLRIHDNHGLYVSLQEKSPVLPIFIFDSEIISDLPIDDARVNFIYQHLRKIDTQLKELDSGLKILIGKPIQCFEKLIAEYTINAVITNRDYEPYAIQRDAQIQTLLAAHNIAFKTYKDQVIFETSEVLKADGHPYTVYTPYKNKWLEKFNGNNLQNFPSENINNYVKECTSFPKLAHLGIKKSTIEVKDFNLKNLNNYAENRDIPCMDGTSNLSPHLRFGTISIREIISETKENPTFLSELIWREFFMQILYHFPSVVQNNFKPKYNGIQWRNNLEEFEKWKKGETGYPIVDAGMRELNKTGYMHNRVRMITAGFLCKHLLIDWRWGEAYFAEKLLDYELASNNGNWQWAAGTGCDATPYFRIFNPITQLKKFDPKFIYVRKWIEDIDSLLYPPPMVEHKFARERALKTYKKGLSLS